MVPSSTVTVVSKLRVNMVGVFEGCGCLKMPNLSEHVKRGRV